MKNGNNNKCAFGERAISYLYGEIDARGKGVFEEHLKICSNCADDIAGFGLIRSSILEWNTEEFQSLATPKFEFQPVPSAEVKNISISRVKTNFLIERLRNLFIPAPVWATGFIFFIVLGGLIMYVYNFSTGNQIVEINTEKSQPVNSSSVNFNTESEVAGKIISDDQSRVSEEMMPESVKPADKNLIAGDSESKETNFRVAPVRKIKPNLSKIYPKVSRENLSATTRKSGNLNAAVAKVSTRKPPVPRLEQIEDGEDEATLRLTDLFDEVGDK